MNSLNMSIKEWYTKTYPSDTLGETLNETTTFSDLANLLDSGEGDVYKLLGGDADSVIRERSFEKLSELKDIDYNEIYYKWLSLEKSSEEIQL